MGENGAAQTGPIGRADAGHRLVVADGLRAGGTRPVSSGRGVRSMSVLPARTGLAAMPGARRVTVSPSPPRTHWEAPLALAGTVLVALGLRAAVVSLPPIYDRIAQSFPAGLGAQGPMGSLPLLCFAPFGIFATRVTRGFGLGTARTPGPAGSWPRR